MSVQAVSAMTSKPFILAATAQPGYPVLRSSATASIATLRAG
jgi:hypothetical protein